MKPPIELSGGEQQRVRLPGSGQRTQGHLLADEPTETWIPRWPGIMDLLFSLTGTQYQPCSSSPMNPASLPNPAHILSGMAWLRDIL